MPRLSAAPIILTPAQADGLQRLARAHKTPRKLAERAEMILRSAAGDGRARDRAPAWRLAEDGAPLARLLAGQRGRYAGDRTAFGCIAAGGTSDVHARAGLRDHGAGLRTTRAERSAAQPLEPERTGPRSHQARHRRQHLARLGRAVFKKVATSSRIACAAGSRPSRTLSSRPSAPISAPSTTTRPQQRSRTSAPSRSMR